MDANSENNMENQTAIENLKEEVKILNASFFIYFFSVGRYVM